MNRPPPLPPELWHTLPDAVRASIDALYATIDALQRRFANLEARLKLNSTNSCKPPSTDLPTVQRAPPETPSGKKPGEQLGHAQNQRPFVECPDRGHDCQPTICRNCRQPVPC